MNRTDGDTRPNEARPSTSAWERALYRASASRGVLALLLVAVGVFLTLAVWTGLQDAQRIPQVPMAPQATSPIASAPWQAEPASGTTSTPAPAQAPTPEPPAQQISRCMSRAGSASYSDAPCPTGTFESIVTVRPDTNLAEGLAPETRQASIRSNAAASRNAAP